MPVCPYVCSCVNTLKPNWLIDINIILYLNFRHSYLPNFSIIYKKEITVELCNSSYKEILYIY